MEALGSVLKKRREDLGLSLREVEDKSSISNAYLSQLENQKIVQPSPAVLKKLADIYSVSYARLMEIAGYPSLAPKDSSWISFKTSSGLEEITKEEEKELLEYLRFIRRRRSK
jgi:HTH-type transcriptional regulator, competence development regulator